MCLVAKLLIFGVSASLPESSRPVSLAQDTARMQTPQPLAQVVGTDEPQNRYPNLGFLGSPSGFAIFNQVGSMNDCQVEQAPSSSSRCPLPSNIYMCKSANQRAMHVLMEMFTLDVVKLGEHVSAWLETGANLALAEPFVLGCIEAVVNCPWRRETASLQTESLELTEVLALRSRKLMVNTCRTLKLANDSTQDDYLTQMTGPSMRWETMGIFCAAAARATIDTMRFPRLYSTEAGRKSLSRTLTYISDCCLEICLAIDCLNEVQIILQYEHFHLHCQVHGEKSVYSQRVILKHRRTGSPC